MKKRHLLYSIILTVVFVVLFSMQSYSKAYAASKPAAKKKNVTLYTDSDAYTIKFKNVSEDAVIKYSSSDKTVVKIKKAKVVPVNPGVATVTAKIKQNGKTYKVKVNFTVLEALPDYDALAKERIKELTKSAENKKNITATYNGTLITSEEELKNYIYECGSIYTSYPIFLSDINLLRSEKEYMDTFSGISSLEFSDVLIYKNVTRVIVTSYSDFLGYPEEFAIYCALSSEDTSYLNSNELDLYKKVVSISKQCKTNSEYNTVKNIHDYLVLNIAYSPNIYAEGVHTLRNAIIKGSCVCDGYSKAFRFLCKAAGIDSIFVIGTAKNSSGRVDSHAWNKVKIDGNWYSMDVTWDDPTPDEPGRIKYNYFLLTDADIETNHTWDNTDLPIADSEDLGYLYVTYKDVDKFTSTEDIIDYIDSLVPVSASKSFEVNITLIDQSGNSYTAESVKSLLQQYHSNYGYGYHYSYEGLAFYGTLFEIVVYR